jgi:peptidoglycan/LPS O-acetylase OafA/YrhL
MLGMAGAQIYRLRMFARYASTQFALGALLMASAAGLWAAWYRGHFPFAIAGLFNIPFDVGMLLLVNALIVGCRPIARVVCVWPLQMSGLMCYSLYLWHGLIITHYRQSAYTAPTYIGYIAITYLIAWLSYRYIEFGATRDWKALLPARQLSLSRTTAADAR